MRELQIMMQVLAFWFGEPTSSDYGKSRPIWFESTPSLDEEIRVKFGKDYEQAKLGKLDVLKETPDGALALIILLDQFPRNMFRGKKDAFSTDAKAREISKYALQKGFDQKLSHQMMRAFIYIPLQHSEDMVDQDLSVKFFEKLGAQNYLKYAISHRDTIKKFGRFPSRNEALGRANTPEEIKYLKK